MHVISERAVPFSILTAQFICLIPRRSHRLSYPRIHMLYIYDKFQHRPRGFLLCARERSGRREEDWMMLSGINRGALGARGDLARRMVREGCYSRGHETGRKLCLRTKTREFSVASGLIRFVGPTLCFQLFSTAIQGSRFYTDHIVTDLIERLKGEEGDLDVRKFDYHHCSQHKNRDNETFFGENKTFDCLCLYLFMFALKKKKKKKMHLTVLC